VEQKKEPASKARKLSWKERGTRRHGSRIMAEEAEIARIEALFLEPDFTVNTAPQNRSADRKIAATKAESGKSCTTAGTAGGDG